MNERLTSFFLKKNLKQGRRPQEVQVDFKVQLR